MTDRDFEEAFEDEARAAKHLCDELERLAQRFATEYKMTSATYVGCLVYHLADRLITDWHEANDT